MAEEQLPEIQRLQGQTGQERLRSLTRRLHVAQEEERKRLAREVHDVVGQSLTALRMDVSWLEDNIPDNAPPSFAERVVDASVLVDRTIEVVRRISQDLRPGVLDHFGLTAAMEWQAEQFQKRSGIFCRFRDDAGLQFDRLDSELSTALFRILQEALTNVARHAEAKHVDVVLSRGDDALRLAVQDDGRGFDPKAARDRPSLGLLSMEERVIPWRGSVDVESAPGRGTSLVVCVPISQFDEVAG